MVYLFVGSLKEFLILKHWAREGRDLLCALSDAPHLWHLVDSESLLGWMSEQCPVLTTGLALTLVIPRRSEAGAGGFSPPGYCVLLSEHVWDGWRLLSEDSVPLSSMATESQGGPVLRQGVLPPGPPHFLPAEGKNWSSMVDFWELPIQPLFAEKDSEGLWSRDERTSGLRWSTFIQRIWMKGWFHWEHEVFFLLNPTGEVCQMF